MAQRHRYIPFVITAMVLAALAAGCSGGQEQKNPPSEHKNWILSLADSITDTQSEITSIQTRIDSLHTAVGEMLQGFRHISNPREVEGYTLANSLAGQLPLTATGLAARITEGEGFELLSALSGNTYCQLRAVTPEGSATTAVVPHDQALNYRHSGYNTVAFSGAAADSVGRIIALAPEGKVRIEFLQPSGRVASTLTLPAARQKVIAETWRLYDAQSTAEHLELKVKMLNRKISLLRMRIDRDDPIPKTDR
ncbi:MAG: hypothetical protein K2H47_07500 [Muribaculaceae bacterium]|nr:hypothetical protein [Muribaculaceae bacterium]